MLTSKTFPCFSLQTVTKCIGIIDLCVGLLNFIVMLFRLKEATEKRYIQFTLDFVTEHGFSLGTFPALNALPLEFAIASLVCYAVQFNMGALLFIGAAKQNLSVVYFWIVISAGTASFTGVFIRVYEIVTVYDYARQLKDEEEISSINAQYEEQQRREANRVTRLSSSPHSRFNLNCSVPGDLNQVPPRYGDTCHHSISISKEEAPPSYEEAISMTIRWMYAAKGIGKEKEQEQEEKMLSFRA